MLRLPGADNYHRMMPIDAGSTTSSLEGREQRTEGLQGQEIANTNANACATACTNPADSTKATAAIVPDVGPAGGHFAEALAMLARLPLTDAERAEAVRRLLAGGTDEKPKAPGA